MNTEYSSFEREIIRALFEKGDWIDIYDLHEKYFLSAAQIAYALRRLEAENAIDRDGLNVRLNEFGTKWVLINRENILLKQRKFWTNPSKGSIKSRHPASEPYLPKNKKLNTKFFNQK